MSRKQIFFTVAVLVFLNLFVYNNCSDYSADSTVSESSGRLATVSYFDASGERKIAKRKYEVIEKLIVIEGDLAIKIED